jgi:hypothetical protein
MPLYNEIEPTGDGIWTFQEKAIPTLAPGYRFADPIKSADIQLEDRIHIMPTPTYAGFSGRVVKVNRVNLQVECFYQVAPTMEPIQQIHTIRKLHVDYVVRGTLVHPVEKH